MNKKRIAILDYKLCRPEFCGRACIKVCPVNRMGKECIVENENINISEELCTGCGICPHKCPFGAIAIINLELNLDDPIHQYGKNRFRLFRLPQIKDNETVGLIGKNGIGKSTIVQILSGKIIPNLGNLGTTKNYDPIIDFYKGRDSQRIFLKLKNNAFAISYKPQNVEAISEIYDATVVDLLKKADTKNMFDSIVKDLELESILNRNIKTLSGGELQKVAIAATIMKDAEVYFYDEPSSFLDIKQRFIFANMLNKYKNSNLLVEHDLALLDYLSDYLHILFGQPHGYGIVSNIKSTNLAINEFLEGFIKDENLRFRNYQIEFVYVEDKKIAKPNILFTYPLLKKQFVGFEFSADAGEIYSGEVIGILGENGIGKSTFVKLIAGLEKPDNTTFFNDLQISYKPQSLKLEDKNITVMELLKNTNQELLQTELWGKLNLEKIKDYKLSELNGGDLQKVFISKCLATDADIYLIDEPSAFLDVEERLNVAKAIRNIIYKRKKAGFIVDHDILFIDYISDKVLVFEGIPAKRGFAHQPENKINGMNKFLKLLNITYRKDPNSKRPRVNKLDSTKDKEQKISGNYYIY